MVYHDQEKFIHPIVSVQATTSDPDSRRIVKTRTAKTLATAVVVGGTLLATGGTSFAAGIHPNGAAVTVVGTGPTAETAVTAATALAEQQCQSGEVTPGFYDNHFAHGTWTSTYTGKCAVPPARRGGDRR